MAIDNNDVYKNGEMWAKAFKIVQHFPIRTLSDYSKSVTAFKRIATDRRIIYRGEPELYDEFHGFPKTTVLLPKIAREPDFNNKPVSIGNSELNITELELEQIRAAKNTHRNLGIPEWSSEWLAYAQHYGYATRLLDWSSNPLVALFFACWNSVLKKEYTHDSDLSDGAVYTLPQSGLRSQALKREEIDPYSDAIDQGIPTSIFEIFEPWTLSVVHPETDHLYRPQSTVINSRMIAQNGLFIWRTPHWERPNSQLYPIIIDGQSKRHLLCELNSFGYSPAELFPDAEGQKWQSLLDLHI